MITDFLYSRPNWKSGAARVLDLFGLFNSYNTSESAEAADRRALRSDWQMVGGDITYAVDSFDPENASGARQDRLFDMTE